MFPRNCLRVRMPQSSDRRERNEVLCLFNRGSLYLVVLSRRWHHQMIQQKQTSLNFAHQPPQCLIKMPAFFWPPLGFLHTNIDASTHAWWFLFVCVYRIKWLLRFLSSSSSKSIPIIIKYKLYMKNMPCWFFALHPTCSWMQITQTEFQHCYQTKLDALISIEMMLSIKSCKGWWWKDRIPKYI